MLEKHKKPNVRDLEPEGFYQGAHGTDTKHVLAEIRAFFARRRAEIQKAAVERMKPIEALIENLKAITSTVEQRWREIQVLFEGRIPMVAGPVLYLAAGLGAMLVEAYLLAPSLDLLNVTELIEQRLVAFVVGVVFAVFFHFAWETFQENHFSRAKIIITRAAGLAALVALVVLGVLRACQNTFAATIAENPLGQFLHEHPVLATLFLVFLTVACPLAAAFGLTFALKDIHDWREYHAAKARAESVPDHLIQSRKQLEAEKEKLVHDLKALESEENQCVNSYLTHYERGQTIGAKQPPKWVVWVQASTTAGIVLAPIVWLLAWSPVLLILPAVTLAAAYLYFRQQRNHPSPDKYYKMQKVRFSEGDRNPQLALPGFASPGLPEPALREEER